MKHFFFHDFILFSWKRYFCELKGISRYSKYVNITNVCEFAWENAEMNSIDKIKENSRQFGSFRMILHRSLYYCTDNGNESSTRIQCFVATGTIFIIIIIMSKYEQNHNQTCMKQLIIKFGWYWWMVQDICVSRWQQVVI